MNDERVKRQQQTTTIKRFLTNLSIYSINQINQSKFNDIKGKRWMMMIVAQIRERTKLNSKESESNSTRDQGKKFSSCFSECYF